MKRVNLGYFLSEGFHSIFTHGIMSFAAVCMILACLLIMGSFTLVAVNLEHMLVGMERENIFLAYIDETYTPEQTQGVGVAIQKIPNVGEVTFVTKQEAKNSYITKYQADDNADVFGTLPDEVFRDRYEIHVLDIEQFGTTVDLVSKLPGVAGYSAEPELAQGFVAVRNVASGVALILVGMLLLMSLFIIANTIKLATFTRRDEIAIMKMCGATNGFVRGPFIVEGILLGLLGAVLAFFLQWGVYSLIGRTISSSDTFQLILVIPFETMALKVLGVFAGVGLLVGVGGSMVAIRKFLQV